MVGSSTDAPTLTLLLAGGRGVGKTSVARRLLGAKFTPSCEPTAGIDEFAGVLDGDSIKIFDPSHTEIANALEVVRGAACVGVLLVCDPADPDSLRVADGWLLRLRQAVVPEVSLLLAHKHDRARARLDAHALDAYCAHRGVLGWRATTALHGRSINAAVATLLQRVALQQVQLIPSPGAAQSSERSLHLSAVSYTHLTLPTNREV